MYARVYFVLVGDHSDSTKAGNCRSLSTVGKSVYYFRHFRPSVRLTACISAALTGQISMKVVIGDFYENMSTDSTFD